MSSSASVLAAATTLVDWAHQRRRRWTDEPLRSMHAERMPEVQAVPEVLARFEVPEVRQVLDDAPPAMLFASEPIEDLPQLPYFAQTYDAPAVADTAPVPEASEIPDVPFAPEPFAPEVPPAIESAMAFDATSLEAPRDVPAAEPVLHDVAHHSRWADLGGRATGALGVCSSMAARAKSLAGSLALQAASTLGDVAKASLERVGPWGDVALWVLTRGAALVSTASVIMLVTLHRGELVTLHRADLFSRWNQLTETVAAAAAVTHPAPPPIVPLPAGSGRLIITSSEDGFQVIVDGKPLGPAPVTAILAAGAHHFVVRSSKGSVERTVHVEAGETIDMKEEIYPGWVAVASAVDLTFSENGRHLKRDERGWAILPPGPHDIHLDNDQLGIHETRHVVVTPGDATRISLAPPASTLSITANEPAEVWVDGSSLGEAPITDVPMKLGTHDVRVRSASHERWLRVRVTTQPTQLNVDLTAE
jgi:PEGA domain